MPSLVIRRRACLLVVGAIALAIGARAHAQFRQFGGGFGRGFSNLRFSTPRDYDGTFQFCRIAFGRDFRGDGYSWNVDWPRADVNLSIRLSELTKTRVGKTPSGEPNHLLLRLTDPLLFSCPFIMMTEVGSAGLTDEEAARLGEYLKKGGFLWADDFWGHYAFEWWEGQLRKALPAKDYPVVTLTPDHPIFNMQFAVKKLPQIPGIGFWMESGGQTSERGADSVPAEARAVLDGHGRIMVLMTHNTDFGDAFEREADDPQYFLLMSVPGYQFGVNALLYSMTH